MSGATQAREKRAKTRGDGYCKRPAHLPSNAPKPRYAYLAQHMLILSWAIVLKAMWSLKPKQLPDGDWVLHASITQIVEATKPIMAIIYGEAAAQPMARRTVGNALAALRKRGYLERFDAARSVTSPFGTIWRIRRHERVKALIDADPAIGKVTTASGKKAYYVIGKGRRAAASEELLDWNIDHVIAENTPAAHVPDLPIALDEPLKQQEPAKQEKPRRLTVQEELIEDTAVIHRAILEQGVDAEPENAAALLAIARGVEPSIPATSVAMLVHEIAAKYVAAARKRTAGNTIRITWTVGWFTHDLPGAVHRWRYERDQAQAATGTRA